jgi:hypothetical protein
MHMNIPNDIAALTKLFDSLGAPDGASLARSQINEGIPQLQRFVFLRQAWKSILVENNTSWIEKNVSDAKHRPDAPFSGIGQALERLLAVGGNAQDITDIAPALQVQLLFQLCYLLDDPAFVDPELQGLSWGLFEADDDDNPRGSRIGGLYESVLAHDPTCREMRPRQE